MEKPTPTLKLMEKHINAIHFFISYTKTHACTQFQQLFLFHFPRRLWKFVQARICITSILCSSYSFSSPSQMINTIILVLIISEFYRRVKLTNRHLIKHKLKLVPNSIKNKYKHKPKSDSKPTPKLKDQMRLTLIIDPVFLVSARNQDVNRA